MNIDITKNRTSAIPLKRSLEGFSLIEVLIAMLILAIGLLGIATLQFKGMKYSTDAFIRSQITMVSSNIADRIRLNKDNASSYDGTSYTVPTTAPSGCTETSGSSVANDISCWQELLYESVPPGTIATIDSTSNALGETYRVRLVWTDREGTPHSIDYSFMP